MEIENVRKNINHLEKLLQREKALLSQEKEIANSMIANNSLKGGLAIVLFHNQIIKLFFCIK